VRSELEQLVSKLGLEDEVSLPGYIKNPYPYMKNADVFVLSSYYEGLGYVLLEALAVGTPIVSTNCPSGPDEVLEHGKYGRLVGVQDANGLASAILATLSEPPDPQLLQKRARDFHLDSIVEQYLNALNKLVEHN
jgi:glycosyltransferase involved in cell wall biosynthesis